MLSPLYLRSCTCSPCIPGPWIVFKAKHWNVKQMEKMPPPPHRKTGFPGVTRCRLSRTPAALVQVAQNPCRTKMVKALTRLVAHLSQLYSAIVPSRASSSDGLNVTVLCAGAPGKPHPDPEAGIQRRLSVKLYIHSYIEVYIWRRELCFVVSWCKFLECLFFNMHFVVIVLMFSYIWRRNDF